MARTISTFYSVLKPDILKNNYGDICVTMPIVLVLHQSLQFKLVPEQCGTAISERSI